MVRLRLCSRWELWRKYRGEAYQTAGCLSPENPEIQVECPDYKVVLLQDSDICFDRCLALSYRIFPGNSILIVIFYI